MKNVLILGAGRSSTALIEYLLDYTSGSDKLVHVADARLDMAAKKIGNHPNGRAYQLDIRNVDRRRELLGIADIVVSLLPAFLHEGVARDCVLMNKHLFTASYVSPEMNDIARSGRKKGLIFMGELGLDPGLDHMSAMKQIDFMKEKGATIKSFKSYTGGLVAPESDDNPWHYKFTWNPRNVILAGQGTAQYLRNGRFKYIPYHQLFRRYELVEIIGQGKFEMYANRDSLNYRKTYGLDEIPTLLRGTLRHIGFCEAWDAFIRIGLTDDSYPILDSHALTYRELIEAYCYGDASASVEERVAAILDVDVNAPVMYKLKWAGIFDDEPIGLRNATPAQILEHRLKSKWNLRPDDKDMIIMQHEFEYSLDGHDHELYSTLTMQGENAENTAMSKLVGLPLGVFVKLVMEGQITQSSESHVPVSSEIYEPVLAELATYGVKFEEVSRVVRASALS